MKKIAYLLSVYLFCLLPKLQAQDIDFPLSLSPRFSVIMLLLRSSECSAAPCPQKIMQA